MKKFYFLLASAMVALSGAAAPLLPVKEYKSTKVVGQELRLPVAEIPDFSSFNATEDPTFGPARAVTDATGNKWMFQLTLGGTAVDFFGLYFEEPGDATFDDLPFYAVTGYARPNYQGAPSNIMQYFFMWPCEAYYNEGCYSKDAQGKEYLDFDKAATVFGSKEAAMAPAKISTVIDDNSGFNLSVQGNTLIPALNSFYSLLSMMAYPNAITYNGSRSYTLKECTITQQGVSYNNAAYIIWPNYEPDYGTVSNMEFYNPIGIYNQQTGTVPSVAANINFVLSGAPNFIGLRENLVEVGELHIFNCGLTDWDSAYGQNYEYDFEPVNRYYLTWCDPTMTYKGYRQSGEEVHAWDSDILQNGLLETIQPLTNKVSDYNFTFWNAALYAPAGTAGAENLTGKWSMPMPKFTANQATGVIESWESTPAAYELVPYSYEYGICDQDGFFCVMNSLYNYPGPEYSFIGFGDKTYGFNFRYSQEGWGENYILGSYTSPAVYHPDMNNWNTTQSIPTIGTTDQNVITGEVQGVEEVESNAAVVATQYFNLQGQRLNAAPQQGIFIQRVIKADGSVKATKVVK